MLVIAGRMGYCNWGAGKGKLLCIVGSSRGGRGITKWASASWIRSGQPTHADALSKRKKKRNKKKEKQQSISIGIVWEGWHLIMVNWDLICSVCDLPQCWAELVAIWTSSEFRDCLLMSEGVFSESDSSEEDP